MKLKGSGDTVHDIMAAARNRLTHSAPLVAENGEQRAWVTSRESHQSAARIRTRAPGETTWKKRKREDGPELT